jgi:hypothetical protein
MRYNIAAQDGIRESVTMFHDGQEHVATNTHPRFEAIIEALESNDPPGVVTALFDLTVPVSEAFTRVSDRVMVSHGEVLFDGDVVTSAISQPMMALLDEKDADFTPLALFLEKAEQNPLEHSREQMFNWLRANDFTLTRDGDIIAYKGVQRAREGGYLSLSSGTAIVNGRPVHGQIPTNPGTIVEMPRSEVSHDPTEACSTGLHAGDWSYASSFGPVTLRVLINPRDVVSVPTDCAEKKIRVCRYRVLGEVTAPGLGIDDVPGDLPLATLPEDDTPEYFEEYEVEDFEAMPEPERQWLAEEWAAGEPEPRALFARARQRVAKLMGRA